MDFLWFAVWMVGTLFVIEILKRIGMMLAFYLFGWRPSILKKPIMDQIADECTERAIRQSLEVPESQYMDLDEEDRKRWREELKNFSVHVIEQYALRYSMSK